MKPRKNKAGGRSVYDDSLKIAVARDYLTGNLSYSQVAEKYGITGGREVVNGFIRWYKKRYDLQLSKSKSLLPDTRQQKATTGKTIKELQEDLADANLKIAALEIMIQIAEKELGIDIRKKSGTKQ